VTVQLLEKRLKASRHNAPFHLGRTVDSHVQGILNKLGFDSRAQIAARLVTDRSLN